MSSLRNWQGSDIQLTNPLSIGEIKVFRRPWQELLDVKNRSGLLGVGIDWNKSNTLRPKTRPHSRLLELSLTHIKWYPFYTHLGLTWHHLSRILSGVTRVEDRKYGNTWMDGNPHFTWLTELRLIILYCFYYPIIKNLSQGFSDTEDKTTCGGRGEGQRETTEWESKRDIEFRERDPSFDGITVMGRPFLVHLS